MKSATYISVMAAGLALAACGNKSEPKSADPCGGDPCAAKKASEGEPDATKPEIKADYIHVLAGHTKPEQQAGDPTVVSFPDFKVTAASFDPADLTGGTAEIEVQIATLSSGNGKRDGHLNSNDLLDSETYPSAKISISDVAKTETEGMYTATMGIDYRGIQKEWNVGFSVIQSTDTSIKIAVKHDFDLATFNVGNAGGAIADGLKLDAVLTLHTEA